MNDNDLELLKDIPQPPLSDERQAQSVNAGLQAFRLAQSRSASADGMTPPQAAAKKNQKKFQGFLGFLRHIVTIHQTVGSIIMRKQFFVGTAAASMLIVMVGLQQQWWSGLDHVVEENVVEEEVVTADQASDLIASSGVVADAALAPSPQQLSAPEVQEHTASLIPLKQRLSDAASAAGQPAMARGLNAEKKTLHAAARPQAMIYPYPPVSPPRAERPTGDSFTEFEENALHKASEHPVSTFSIDVDTAAYTYVRRQLNQGRLPQKESIRVEELINYFDYDYPVPTSKEQPFLPSVAIYPTPWNANTKLLHIGIKGHESVSAQKKRSNLVFLIDVSGSMQQPDKLPLLIKAFKLLINTLSETDRVAIVTYAGQAGTVLPSTLASKKSDIFAALSQLQAGGGTAGAQGIEQAYALAKENFIDQGVNRVILATDGDFNVGISDPNALKSFIEKKRNSGIYLSVLGFGQGNYNDALMQSLAQAGNGNAAYIDSLSEAQKVLVDEASATLFPIANDVKIQVEFNPAKVAEYRLIGYETRALKREDFNNDKVDAGDIGAGHTVTALYEVTPVGSAAQLHDELRYQPEEFDGQADVAVSEEYAFLKLRYKRPGESESQLLSVALGAEQLSNSVDEVSADYRFAAAVAALGQKLHGSTWVSDFDFAQIIDLANSAKGEDPYGYRSEFVKLVRLAASLAAQE
jgi:Ca-activated chloride channel family protein